MALQGNLRDFAATEILQLLGSQKKTGCLLLEWNAERAIVFVSEGRIVSTRRPGMTKDDPLLAFLIGVGRLSDEQYRGILAIQRESSRDLEDLLLNGRYLETEELAGFVERQILDDLMRMTRWENGNYRFDPNQRWPNTPLVRLNIEGALIEAARRIDEQKGFVTIFKDPYQLLGVRDLPDPNEPLSEEEREMFGIIDGQHTVAEVVEAAPLSEYETYEALHRMLVANWIEFVGRKNPGLEALAAAPQKVRKQGLSLVRELALAVLVVAALFGMHWSSRWLPAATANAPDDDVFVTAQVRDMRFALDLYRRERGAYPARLSDLVEDRWLSPAQIRIPGDLVSYRRSGDGQEYHLSVVAER